MSARLTQSQAQGQATVEALLIIVFGFLLVLGIHHIGQLRSHTLHLIGESHFLILIEENLTVTNSPITKSKHYYWSLVQKC